MNTLKREKEKKTRVTREEYLIWKRECLGYLIRRFAEKNEAY
jgi:hypothetical protein